MEKFRFVKIALFTLVTSVVVILTSCRDEEPPIPESFVPKKISLADLDTSYYQQTIMVDSVYFDHPAGTKLNGTNSNANGGKTIKDCYGNSAIVHTSPSSDLSDYYIPTGMGPLTAYVDKYQDQVQLVLREYADISSMTQEKCTITTQATTATIPGILAGNFASGSWVKIDSVEYENTSNNMDDKNNIVDCDGNSLKSFVFSSNTELGGVAVPTGNGPIYGEIELYNSVWEIKPQTKDDIAQMTGTRCTAGPIATCDDLANNKYLIKDFEDGNISTCGWTTKAVVGTADWFVDSFNGASFAKMTNFSGGSNSASEAWLISPAVDISSTTAPKLSFTNANGPYPGDSLTLLVSTDYDGTSAPSTATWTNITDSATWDTDYSTWADPFINSGNIDITPYKSTTFYVAFKYIGTASDGATWEIDDVLIFE